jgi:hypothetical protein
MSTPITTIEFQDNFSVRIVEYTANLLNSDIHVEFEVKCSLNERLSIHKTDVDTSILSEGYTSQDVLNSAWNGVKGDVNAWATSTVVKSQIDIYDPLTVTDDISLEDFNTNFDVQVLRLNLYPSTKPTSWCIAFNIVMKNRTTSSLYADCVVSTSDFCGNTLCLSILEAGWNLLKQRICSWASGEFASTVVLNSPYAPTDVDVSS